MFSKDNSISVFPIKVLYSYSLNTAESIQAGVTVSSRKFKKAVERNRVKRILREAYRLQKAHLQNTLREKNVFLALFFIYTGKELPVFYEVYEKMGIILQKLEKNIENLLP